MAGACVPAIVCKVVQNITCYMSPGLPIFTNAGDSNKFISFVFVNMDGPHRVQWGELTGREQFEWYAAWERADRTYTRVVNETGGLCGTDLASITTQAMLDAAVLRPTM